MERIFIPLSLKSTTNTVRELWEKITDHAHLTICSRDSDCFQLSPKVLSDYLPKFLHHPDSRFLI